MIQDDIERIKKSKVKNKNYLITQLLRCEKLSTTPFLTPSLELIQYQNSIKKAQTGATT